MFSRTGQVTILLYIFLYSFIQLIFILPESYQVCIRHTIYHVTGRTAQSRPALWDEPHVRRAGSAGSTQEGVKNSSELSGTGKGLSERTKSKYKSAGVGAALRRGNRMACSEIQRNSLEFRMWGRVTVKDWQEPDQAGCLNCVKLTLHFVLRATENH